MKYFIYSLAALGLLAALWRIQFDHSGQPALWISDTHIPTSQRASRPHPYGTIPQGTESVYASDHTAELYRIHCAYCHGSNGNGQSYTARYPGMPTVANLTTSERSASELHQIISNGRGAMPAFRHRLPTNQHTSLTDYILTTLQPAKP